MEMEPVQPPTVEKNQTDDSSVADSAVLPAVLDARRGFTYHVSLKMFHCEFILAFFVFVLLKGNRSPGPGFGRYLVLHRAFGEVKEAPDDTTLVQQATATPSEVGFTLLVQPHEKILKKMSITAAEIRISIGRVKGQVEQSVSALTALSKKLKLIDEQTSRLSETEKEFRIFFPRTAVPAPYTALAQLRGQCASDFNELISNL